VSQEGLTRFSRLLVSRVAVLKPSGGGACFGSARLRAGRGREAWTEKNPEGEETHKSSGRQAGATRVGRERIREGIKASESVKLAEWIGSVARVQNDREASLGSSEREFIVARGARQLRQKRGSR